MGSAASQGGLSLAPPWRAMPMRAVIFTDPLALTCLLACGSLPDYSRAHGNVGHQCGYPVWVVSAMGSATRALPSTWDMVFGCQCWLVTTHEWFFDHFGRFIPLAPLRAVTHCWSRLSLPLVHVGQKLASP